MTLVRSWFLFPDLTTKKGLGAAEPSLHTGLSSAQRVACGSRAGRWRRERRPRPVPGPATSQGSAGRPPPQEGRTSGTGS